MNRWDIFMNRAGNRVTSSLSSFHLHFSKYQRSSSSHSLHIMYYHINRYHRAKYTISLRMRRQCNEGNTGFLQTLFSSTSRQQWGTLPETEETLYQNREQQHIQMPYVACRLTIVAITFIAPVNRTPTQRRYYFRYAFIIFSCQSLPFSLHFDEQHTFEYRTVTFSFSAFAPPAAFPLLLVISAFRCQNILFQPRQYWHQRGE